MKTKLATAIAFSLLAGTTFAAPTFYGEIDLSLDHVQADNKNGVEDRHITDLNSNNSFLGLKGDEKLTDRLSALYQAEFTFYVDNGGSTDTFVPRNLLIGLKDEKLGTLKAGKIDTPVKQLSSVVDTFNNYVANNADVAGIMAGENRIDNVLVYETPAFNVGEGKLEAKLQLATGEGNDTINSTKGGYTVAGRGLGDSWSSSVVYSDKTFVAGLGYDKAIPSRFLGRGFLNADNTAPLLGQDVTASRNVIAEANTIRAIGRINLDNGLSLRALYQNSDIENASASPTANQAAAATIDDAQAWLIGAEYNLPNAKNWTVKGQYSYSDVTFNNASPDFEVNQILAGVDYAFSKQVKVYGTAGYLTVEQGSDEDKQILVGTGFEYKF
ncbi:porin [Acinetobacter lwoffii]|uniref:Porin n=1 Tax=Acinetobacter lwoffii TaxID=28090 RepID=A0A6N1MUW5_ACILW|nr:MULTISPECIES: porin [Pseudomonadota]MCO8093374.1 porin [Acinetobacter lwoffii]MCU4420942.1 porin [Acinetobacter lwoffii]MCU4450063.1 porin [Acinetobacter lwoffii]MDP1371120.1 porin [Acinetobacter lwoffii]MDP1390546.1 porin [Acinetobacter lwoffii]